MLKLFEIMNKEAMKWALKADKHKMILRSWHRDNSTVYTDGVIAYIIPDGFNRVLLPEQYQIPGIQFKTDNKQLEPCKEMHIDGNKTVYLTSFEHIGIDIKLLKTFPECQVYSVPTERGMFLIYYGELFVGVIMGKRIKS